MPDEPLLADDEVHFQGMPVAIVVADTEETARKAAKKITAEIEPLEPVTDPRVAAAKESFIVPPKKFVLGDTANAFQNCEHVFEGRAEQNGQEHLYIETQGAYAVPTENGGLKVYSSTQGPTAVQRAVCRVTGLPMHQVEVDVQRLGGGFGGKEDQANAWAAICAVATQLTRRPVKYALHRMEDMRMTGKRHPYSADYKIGLDKDLKIVAYEATFYQNAGAACDLSPPVLERTLFHCTNQYFIPNVTATAYCCRTNLPPNTAFRGFGGPQGMFVIESAIAHAAEKLGVSAAEIQQEESDRSTATNSLTARSPRAKRSPSWTQADAKYDFAQLQKEADEFNASSKYFKKGVAADAGLLWHLVYQDADESGAFAGSRLHRRQRRCFDRRGRDGSGRKHKNGAGRGADVRSADRARQGSHDQHASYRQHFADRRVGRRRS